jgi:hypothetical protein
MKFEKLKIKKHNATMDPNAMPDMINCMFESWAMLPGTGGFRLCK